jgi:hypothetical protein
MSYANDLYFRKSPRIDEQFGVDQQFSTKSELKLKIADFHVQWNIKLEVTNNSKLKLVMKYKDSNFSWRMYATPPHNGYLGYHNKSVRALLFWQCYYGRPQLDDF